MTKEAYVRTLEPYFVKRAEEPFWSYSHPQNLLKNGDFETWTAGSAVGDEPDGWTESGVGDVQREAATVKRCTYSAELTHPGGAGGSTLYQAASCASFYRGLYVSLSAWVYADDASRVRLSLADGVTTTYSEYHPGDGAWWLLTVVKLIAAAANQVTMAFRIETGAGAVVAWIDAAHLCLGPVPRGFAEKPLYDDGTVTIEGGVITKDVQEGDPRQVYSIGGVAKAVTGVDDDDGDKFKVAIGTSVLGTAADVLTVDPATQYVGIGETSPLDVLTIVEAGAAEVGVLAGQGIGLSVFNNTNVYIAARDTVSDKEFAFGTSGAGTVFMGSMTNHQLDLRVNNANRMIIDTSGNVVIGAAAALAKMHIDQASAVAAIPVLLLDQADLSEEFIELTTTVGAGNPIDTAALGAYYGKMRVNVTGVGYKWIALYN